MLPLEAVGLCSILILYVEYVDKQVQGICYQNIIC